MGQSLLAGTVSNFARPAVALLAVSRSLKPCQLRILLLTTVATLVLLKMCSPPEVNSRRPQQRRRALEAAPSGLAVAVMGPSTDTLLPGTHSVAVVATAGQEPSPQPAKVVSVLACDQFGQFRRVMAALQQALGAEEYTVVLSIDRPPQDAAAGSGAAPNSTTAGQGATPSPASAAQRDWQRIIEHGQQLQALSELRKPGAFRAVLVNVSDTHLGPGANRRRAAAGAMTLTDYALLLEGNVGLAPDALHWFEWLGRSGGFLASHPHVATASCWSPSFPADGTPSEAADRLVVQQLGLLDKFFLDSWTQPWGLALPRRTWDAVHRAWEGGDAHLAQLVQAQGWVQALPVVPRCTVLPPGDSGSARGTTGGGSSVANCSSGGGAATDEQPAELPPPPPVLLPQRSLTSGAFPASLMRCAAEGYTLLPRGNTSCPVHEFELYSTFVRYGILPDHRLDGLTLPELSAHMGVWTRRHPRPSQWQSAC